MKAIIFDFGGTLDTDGTHWGIKFLEAYHSAGILVPDKIFRNAYVSAEKDMPGSLENNAGLLDTFNKQISFQLRHLVEDYNWRFYNDVSEITRQISTLCYDEVKKNIVPIYSILSRLSQRYELGVISNFYGNLVQVLKELDFNKFFSVVMDSEITGLRKPGSQVYIQLMNKMSLRPEDLIMVGDSYENDIIPSKNLGYRTIWLRGKCWKYPEDWSKADFIIGSISELEDAVNIMEKTCFGRSLSPYIN